MMMIFWMMIKRKTTSGNPADEMDFYPKTGHNEQAETDGRKRLTKRWRKGKAEKERENGELWKKAGKPVAKTSTAQKKKEKKRNCRKKNHNISKSGPCPNSIPLRLTTTYG